MKKQTIHFTDLKEFAVRGEPRPGKIYVKCHDSRGNNNFSDSAFASRIEILSPVRKYGANCEFALPSLVGQPIVDVRHISSGRVKTVFLSDSGCWDIPSINYRNKVNYLLDVAALRRKGIRVDLTTIHKISEER